MKNGDKLIRLNKYISNAGLCSRRKADELIQQGFISVNENVVKEVGTKVKPTDKVKYKGNLLSIEKKIYLVLNKPKNYITTVKDRYAEKNVMELLQGACNERVYPVGRLDKNTTGVLLFTNDGDLAKKLTHPKYNKKKIYHVFLDKDISQIYLNQILKGIELEDGFIKADAISYVKNNKSQIGIEIHSGKKRIVRRIFQYFDYEIKQLDRVYFAGITKKNLPKGKWRFLTNEEIRLLKYF